MRVRTLAITEHREEGLGHTDRADVVGRQVTADEVEIAVGSSAEAEDPGVVHQQRHVGGRARRIRDAVRVGDIERQEPHSRIGGEVQVTHRPRVASGGVDPSGAGIEQLPNEPGTKPAVSPGDERNASPDCHDRFLQVVRRVGDAIHRKPRPLG